MEYAQAYCRCCDQRDLRLEPALLRGRITSLVWYHRQYTALFPVPYNVTVTRLHDGPEVLGTLDGVEVGDHPVGEAVEVMPQPDGRLRFVVRRTDLLPSPQAPGCCDSTPSDPE